MTNLESDLAFTPLSFSFMQADHKGLVALLPIESHSFMTLAKCLNFILLHVRDYLETKQGIIVGCYPLHILTSKSLNKVQLKTHIFVKVDAPLR